MIHAAFALPSRVLARALGSRGSPSPPAPRRRACVPAPSPEPNRELRSPGRGRSLSRGRRVVHRVRVQLLVVVRGRLRHHRRHDDCLRVRHDLQRTMSATDGGRRSGQQDSRAAAGATRVEYTRPAAAGSSVTIGSLTIWPPFARSPRLEAVELTAAMSSGTLEPRRDGCERAHERECHALAPSRR